MPIRQTKIVAWGASKMLEFYVTHAKGHTISYAVDSDQQRQGKLFHGLEVHSPDRIKSENVSDTAVVLFPVSSIAMQQMLAVLNGWGFALNVNVYVYADLSYESFRAKCRDMLERDVRHSLYDLVKSFTFNSRTPVHTTLLGNMLFLELLDETLKYKGAIAEVGSYNGGNALLALQYLAGRGADTPFYVFDSFDGFPKLSTSDPQSKKSGDYKIEGTLQYILDSFSVFPNAHIVQGFVPETFKELNDDTRYGLVFYDCDLYEPALATFDYFWEKIVPGGFLMVHDYVGGYTGVKKATDEFFSGKGIPIHVFWENTSAVIRKP